MNQINEGWSFCIVSTDGVNTNLVNTVKSIQNEFTNYNNYEIIIVGNSFYKWNAYVRCIHLKSEWIFKPGFSVARLINSLKNKTFKYFFYKTGAICHKKNLAANASKYDKLCVMHDYVSLNKGWLKSFQKFGYEWDICMNKIYDKNGDRDKDWMIWDHPRLITKKGSISPCLLDYDLKSRYMFISGAFFCVKRSFFINNPLNESHFWGEGEDVEWSIRIRDIADYKMNKSASVFYNKVKFNIPKNDSTWLYNRKKLEGIIENNIDNFI